ncbi:uncharacterized protein TM35_000521220 [Trypanosoma theileri]|uniref:Uncharacterized protein n=1 Tax=Trypanosoma theileri TaxID=67003 RepID=A0A1X0NHI3_9TRYP|nr:uncharacterized protein TM35_000521220 [Trypanosoma theileri]ORC83978.1 hypothetical protein TM35_000521220 [Trypanosoma theileri]
MIFQASRSSASGRKVPLEPRRSKACRLHTNPTEATVEWSSNTKCPSHSQCTHTHTHNDSLTCSCQRGTAALTKMYTKSHTYRGEEKNTRAAEEEQLQGTNSRSNRHGIPAGEAQHNGQHTHHRAHRHYSSSYSCSTCCLP